jgi:heme/copper-type cytochrome/quinol oxidase subunit 2
VRKTGRFVIEIAAAALIGAGVPLLWIWIGSLIQSSRGAQHVEGTTAAIIFVGILASYVIVLMIASAIQARSQAADEQAPPRYPWNRSMRDEPYRPGTQKLTPVEAVFVGTAVVASVAMIIWFFAFAGSPLPT